MSFIGEGTLFTSSEFSLGSTSKRFLKHWGKKEHLCPATDSSSKHSLSKTCFNRTEVWPVTCPSQRHISAGWLDCQECWWWNYILLLLIIIIIIIIIIISNISHEKTWTWLRKRNLQRETEYIPIAAQSNAIRTNHIKIRIDKTQQNSKCTFCCDRDETINHIISECSKLAQKEYTTRHD